MKDIKFRIFDKEKNKIRFDFILEAKSGGSCFITTIKDYNGNILDNITLLEYTGLKDKNGREIYNGDILQIGLRKYEVIWEDGFYRLFDRKAKAKEKNCLLNIKDLKIIGNIYENPELIG